VRSSSRRVRPRPPRLATGQVELLDPVGLGGVPVPADFRATLVSTVYGGTSEIQRDIIGKTYGL
jgi:hypothetical protein